MGQSLRQTNFSAGELDPQLQGRTDLPIFSKGAKTVRNFVPLKTGALMSRPGSTFVAEVKEVAAFHNFYGDDIGQFGDGGYTVERPVRLEAFVFSDSETYVLEFGEYYIRFHTFGRTLESAPDVPYEVETSYVAATVWTLRFAQVGNVLTIVAPGYAAMELRRNGPTDWSFTAVSFSPPDAVLPDVGDSYFTNPFNPGSEPQNILTTPFVVVVSEVGTPDPEHPAREWIHAFTAIMQNRTTGEVLESVATVVRYSHPDGEEGNWPASGDPPELTELESQEFAIYPDMPLTLKRLAFELGTDPDYRTLGFRIYRGRGDLFGWIGDTRTRTFVDVGDEPDYAVQPPLGFNPFNSVTDGGLVLRRYPSSVAFFQERRCFGGAQMTSVYELLLHGRRITVGVPEANDRPATLFASASGDYFNFDPRLAIDVHGESLTFDLAAQQLERIVHLVPLERLVVLTDTAAWTIGGQTGSPLDFDSVDARRTDKVGASGVRPLVADGSVLFIRNKGTGARALIPQSADSPYEGVDLSENARHLVTGTNRRIIDWAYQEDPYGLIWAVRADGKLLTLTFDRGRNVVAWALHDSELDSDAGEARYESVCTVPEGEEDAVYVVVSRVVRTEGDADNTRVRYIERLTSRVRRVKESDEDPVNVETPTSTDTDSLYPTDVALDCAFMYRGAPTRSFTDLERHAFKTVYVVARGSPVMTGTVDADGALELDEQQMPALPEANAVDENGAPIWVAHIGLLYECDLESLAVAADTLRQKTVGEVAFELDETRGVKAGQSFEKLTTWKQRKVSDAFGAISAASELFSTPVTSAWNRTARVCLRQSLPLPVTVLGITREVVD